MRMIKEYDLKIISQNMEAKGKMQLGITPSSYEEILKKLLANHHLHIKIR
jgi:hypothetical protein